MTRREKNANYVDALYPDDLTINHSGRLSDRQRRVLSLRAAMWLGIAGLDVTVFIFLAYLQLHYQTSILGYILLGVLLMPTAWISIQNAKPFQEDIRTDEVKSIPGQIHKKAERYRKSWYYTVQVGNKSFVVSSFIYDSVVDNGYYRLYFTPNSRLLLNFDRV